MGMVDCPQNLNQFISGAPIFENTFPEEECEQKRFYGDCFHCFTTAIAIRDKQLKQEVQSEYEARLKADMVAMLTDIQLEIEELDSRAGYDGNGMPTFSTDYIRKNKVNELIQQKINKLKEN